MLLKLSVEFVLFMYLNLNYLLEVPFLPYEKLEDSFKLSVWNPILLLDCKCLKDAFLGTG